MAPLKLVPELAVNQGDARVLILTQFQLILMPVLYGVLGALMDPIARPVVPEQSAPAPELAVNQENARALTRKHNLSILMPVQNGVLGARTDPTAELVAME